MEDHGFEAEEAAPGTFLGRTLELLDQTTLSLADIQRATSLNFYWLRKVKGREIKDPGVNRVQVLYEYLSGQKLLTEAAETPEPSERIASVA